MINVSTEYREAIKAKDRKMHLKLYLTYLNASGEQVTETLTESDINVSTVKISHQNLPSGILEFGGISSRTLSFNLQNTTGKYDGCTIKGGEVALYSGLFVGSDVEYVWAGTYKIQTVSQPLNVIEITAADDIAELNTGYVPGVTFPCSVQTFANDFKAKSGLSSLSGIPSYLLQLTITKDMEGLSLTHQDILAALAECSGGFASQFSDGTTKIKCFADLQDITSAYSVGEHDMRITSKFYNDAHKITGITFCNYDEYLQGTNDYCISLSNNCIMQCLSDDEKKIVISNLYNKYKDFKYMPYECNMRYDPTLELGDPLLFTNVKTKEGTVNVLSFMGNINATVNSNIEISTPETDEIDLQRQRVSNTPTSSGGGGGSTIEEEHENLALVSVYNRLTLPEIGGNQGSNITSSSYYNTNIECISSECYITSGTSGYGNQFIIPCEPLDTGTYTVSMYVKKVNTDSTDVGQFRFQVFDAGAGQLNKTTTQLTGTAAITISGTNWQWISYTFSVGSFKKNPFLQIQSIYLGTKTTSSKHVVLLSKATVEKGSKFTGYRQNKREIINIVGVRTNNIDYHPQAEYLQVSSGYCSVPVCQLTNTTYIPGSSQNFLSCNDSVCHITRQWTSVDIDKFLYINKSSGNTTGIDIMTKDKTSVHKCFVASDMEKYRFLTYATISSDSNNNINIVCNSLTLNGAQVATINDISTIG